MAPYSYKPLQGDQIRLVTILPASKSAEVRLLLDIVSLSTDSKPEFEALSYTWGSTEDPVDIFVGDKAETAALSTTTTLSVTKNLAEALPYLRYDRKPRSFWIDAICVNQAEIPERGHQVERMRDIYTWASCCVVWLGPAAAQSAVALECLQSIGTQAKADYRVRTMAVVEGSHLKPDFDSPVPIKTTVLRAIFRLIQRSWFERLWIWQEIRFASTHSFIQCGRDCLPWQLFRNAIFFLSHKPCHLEGKENRRYYQRLRLVTSLCSHGQSVKISQILQHTYHSKCTDPRDRVFAVLGFINPGITPNYNKTPESVFKELAVASINTTFSLDILHMVEPRLTSTSGLSLPSWVPDLTNHNQVSIMADDYWASGESHAHASFVGENVLRVSGVKRAQVRTVLDVHPQTWDNAEINDILDKIMPPDLLTGNYVGGGKLLDAFVELLVVGKFSELFWPALPSESAGQEFQKKGLLDFLQKRPTQFRLSKETSVLWSHINSNFQNRAFFTTDEGYFGTGPRSLQSGDSVCVFHGLRHAMTLRPAGHGQHRVIGSCFVVGLMHAEAFLGPPRLPARFFLRYFADTKHWILSVRNMDTGEWLPEDPRLGPLPQGWRRENNDGAEGVRPIFVNDRTGARMGSDPRLLPDVLRQRGVDVVDFDLV